MVDNKTCFCIILFTLNIDIGIDIFAGSLQIDLPHLIHFFEIHTGKAVGHGTGSGSGTGKSTNTGNGTTTGKSTGSGIGTSTMITQSTPGSTNQIVSTTTVPGPNFQRTVIFFHQYTLPGQDLFIRGGINK